MDNNGQQWITMDNNGQQWITMDNNGHWTTRCCLESPVYTRRSIGKSCEGGWDKEAEPRRKGKRALNPSFCGWGRLSSLEEKGKVIIGFAVFTCWPVAEEVPLAPIATNKQQKSTILFLQINLVVKNLQYGSLQVEWLWFVKPPFAFQKDAGVRGSDLLHLFHVQCPWPHLWSSYGRLSLTWSPQIIILNILLAWVCLSETVWQTDYTICLPAYAIINNFLFPKVGVSAWLAVDKASFFDRLQIHK